MEPAKRIVIIGGGKMGEAILSGWIASDAAPADTIEAKDIVVVTPGIDRRDFLEGMYAVACVGSPSEVTVRPDLVVLAVKPQVMMQVIAELSQEELFCDGEQPALFISIAAGLETARLVHVLPEGSSLGRVKPNMPLMVGAGASCVCASAASTAEQVEYVAALFGCLGRALVVDEGDMDAVCAVSGSGPAYVAAMVESLRDAAADAGLDRQVAEDLALQTVLGTAQLIMETGMTPEAARESICSPGGTTLAALDAMNAAGFDKVFRAGVEAAVRRSKELAQL